MSSLITVTRERSRRSGVAARMAVLTILAWARARAEDARSDERGLTTAEYCALGAVVVVAAGVLGVAIASFISSRGSTITSTP